MSLPRPRTAPVRNTKVYNERTRKNKDTGRQEREKEAGFLQPVTVRTKSGRVGKFIAEARDGGDEPVVMLAMQNDDTFQIRKMNSLVIVDSEELNNQTKALKKSIGNVADDGTIQLWFKSNSESAWKAAVGFGADPSDWRITKCQKGGQFYEKGVRQGYRIVSVNDKQCNAKNQQQIRRLLRKAKECQIVFEVGTKENLEQYSLKKPSTKEGRSKGKGKRKDPIE